MVPDQIDSALAQLATDAEHKRAVGVAALGIEPMTPDELADAIARNTDPRDAA